MERVQEEPVLGKAQRVRDPVCGMEIEMGDASESRSIDGKVYYFCSPACAGKFATSPHLYCAQGTPSATTGIPEGAGVRSLELPILRLSSTSSARAVEQALLALPGVEAATANAISSRVKVIFDPAKVGVDELIRTLERAGHRADAATARIGIEGIYCASCVARIEDVLLATPGVLKASVNPATEEAVVSYVPSRTDMAALRQAIEEGGYRAREASAPASSEAVDSEGESRDREYRSLMRKWWFGAVVAVPTMLLSYPSLFPILRDVFTMGSEETRLLWMAMGVASLAVMIYSGGQFFTGMWQGLKHRSANMHTLIAIGTATAWVHSTVALLFPQFFPSDEFVDVYYDVTVVVTALVVLGLAMELKAKGRTSEAIKKLIGLQAKTARVVRAGNGHAHVADDGDRQGGRKWHPHSEWRGASGSLEARQHSAG
ncbi:MAG: cation transporter [Dehalococcoidales bacterium]|nr:cation transporter [Dehalococcoidales bacterium]